MRALLGVLALALAVPTTSAAALSDDTSAGPAAAPAAASKPHHKRLPKLHVRKQVQGLVNPWDVQQIGKGRLLITQRDNARLTLWRKGDKRRVKFPSSRVWRNGETGLMSMEVDPRFGQNGRFYTCSGWQKQGGGHDIRVNAWKLNNAATRARHLRTVISGFPTSSNGRHGGCRLLIARNGSMIIGTGDAATGSNPRNRSSLGGKTLRLDPKTGRPWPSNKWVDSTNRNRRYVHTFGHRNVQGLAQRADGSLWSVEHGSFRDDEVNLLRNGGDYGWHPVPGYNESVPMTDQSLPGKQYAARWRSGNPTLATSGATWVSGKRWGRLNGTLAVAALKTQRVLFIKFDAKGKKQWVKAPRKLRSYGRLRSVTRASNGDLLVTSDNDGSDFVIRIHPR